MAVQQHQNHFPDYIPIFIANIVNTLIRGGRYNNAVDNDVVESTLNQGGNTQDVVDSTSRLLDESPTVHTVQVL